MIFTSDILANIDTLSFGMLAIYIVIIYLWGLFTIAINYKIPAPLDTDHLVGKINLVILILLLISSIVFGIL